MMAIIIPRERLNDVWEEHIAAINNPARAMLLEGFRKEIENTSSSIILNERFRIEATKGLVDDRWIEQNHPLWEGVRIVKSKKDKEDNSFLIELRNDLEKVERVDMYLASMIKGEFAKHRSAEEHPVLDELGLIIKNKKPLESAYSILMNKERLASELSSLKEKGHSAAIQRFIGECEARYNRLIELERYLKQWANTINQNSNSLDWTIRQIKEFILDLGIRKMDELVKRMKESDSIKNLIYLPEEVKYLGDLEYAGRDGERKMGLLLKIMLGEKEDDWAHFNDFYDNLESEEHEIIALFGDQDVKKELVNFKKAQHQWLLGWEAKIKEIIARLSSPEHQLHVTEKAMESLRLIIGEYTEKRKKEVSHELKPVLNTLLTLVKKRAQPLNKKDILAICRLREKNLIEYIKKARKRFKKEEEMIFLLWKEIRDTEDSLMRLDSFSEYVTTITRGEGLKKEWMNYLSKNMAILGRGRDGALIFNALGALGQLEKTERDIRLSEIRMIRSIEEKMIQKDGSLRKLSAKLKDYNNRLVLLNALLKEYLMMDKTRKEGASVGGNQYG